MGDPHALGAIGRGVTDEIREPKIRVVIADDHPGVLASIRSLLAADFDVLRAVSGGVELLQAAAETKPDIVVSDIAMGQPDGIEASRQILAGGLAASVIVLTMYNDPDLVDRSLQAGIRGFVLKFDAGEELIAAVRHVVKGGTYLSRNVRKQEP